MLEWRGKYGKTAEFVAKQAMRCGDPVPDFILNAPELQPELNLFIDAYADLATERQIGFGFAPIPWSKVVQYAEVYGYSNEQRERLLYHVRAIDNYLASKDSGVKDAVT